MIDNGKSENGNPPNGEVPLSSILFTDQLYRRPARPRDYAKENRALLQLTEALADSPQTILQTLADMILEMFDSGSAGISLLTSRDNGKNFFWPAISGKWKPYIGGGTPRDFGPCGDVLDHNAPLLFRHIEQRYTYFKPINPPVEECLLVPFYVKGRAVGTIWAVAHDSRCKFDAEDERLMSSLGKFASSAFQVVASLDTIKSQLVEQTHSETELRDSEEKLQKLSHGLELEISIQTAALLERNKEILQQAEQLRELSSRLLQTQDDERRRIARELHDSAGQIITVLGMNLVAAAERMGKKSVGRKLIEESLQLTHRLSGEIRTMSYLLHPPLLDITGLSGAIKWYATGLEERSGLTVELEISEGFGRLPDEMELAVYRIVQECLTNIHRHSGSKTATIRLERHPKVVLVEILDQGRGISAPKLALIQAQRSGVGVAGMRERVRHLNGVMNIQSATDGTTVTVTLPIPFPQEKEAAPGAKASR
jgi:signal transduction histidine kinase